MHHRLVILTNDGLHLVRFTTDVLQILSYFSEQLYITGAATIVSQYNYTVKRKVVRKHE